jgi:hypothetical protein
LITIRLTNGAVSDAENFFGANYPLFGTWWIVLDEKDIPRGNWQFTFTLHGSGTLESGNNSYYVTYLDTGTYPGQKEGK